MILDWLFGRHHFYVSFCVQTVNGYSVSGSVFNTDTKKLKRIQLSEFKRLQLVGVEINTSICITNIVYLGKYLVESEE